jgi:type VI secretion system protein ImpB
MSDSTSIAPKERINIVYKPATGDQGSQVELPFKMLVVGDFKGAAGDNSLEERTVLSLNQGSLDSVMAAVAPKVNIKVKDKLGEDQNAELDLELEFKSLRDFHPDNVSRKFPALGKLMELRDALRALRGPLGNVSEFRRHLEQIIHDESARTALLGELNIDAKAAPAA